MMGEVSSETQLKACGECNTVFGENGYSKKQLGQVNSSSWRCKSCTLVPLLRKNAERTKARMKKRTSPFADPAPRKKGQQVLVDALTTEVLSSAELLTGPGTVDEKEAERTKITMEEQFSGFLDPDPTKKKERQALADALETEILPPAELLTRPDNQGIQTAKNHAATPEKQNREPAKQQRLQTDTVDHKEAERTKTRRKEQPLPFSDPDPTKKKERQALADALTTEILPPAELLTRPDKQEIQTAKNCAATPELQYSKATKEQLRAMDEAGRKIVLKERRFSVPTSEKKNFEFEWASIPITKQDEKFVSDLVVKRCEFGQLDKKRKEYVTKILSARSSMDFNQAMSLRECLLQQKSMFTHGKLQAQAKSIHGRYRKGESVRSIALDIDSPPCSIFKVILAEMNWSKIKISQSMKRPKKFLEAREQRELLASEAADSLTAVNNKDQLVNADLFEDFLASWLDQKGVRYVTQEQLVKEQMRDFGFTVLTPDFLILDEMHINGKRVTWIDAKNFYGANNAFIRKKLIKQMSRYIDHWGEGAVVYNLGFSASLRLDECSFLDAKVIKSDNFCPSFEMKK